MFSSNLFMWDPDKTIRRKTILQPLIRSPLGHPKIVSRIVSLQTIISHQIHIFWKKMFGIKNNSWPLTIFQFIDF